MGEIILMSESTNNQLRSEKTAILGELLNALELYAKARVVINNLETIGQLKLFKKDFKKLKCEVKTKMDKALYKDVLIAIKRKQKELNKMHKALIKRIVNSAQENK